MAHAAEQVTLEKSASANGPQLTVYASRGQVQEQKVLTLSGLSPQDVDAYLHSIELLTQAFTAQLKAMPEDKLAGLVSLLLPAKPTPSTLLREAKLLAKGKTRILTSGDWLTAQEVAEVAQFHTVNASSQPNKWKHAGKIFALRHEGIDYYPVYGLDADTGYRPLKAIAPIISVLAAQKDGWGMAFWFGSANAMLGGKLPKDVLRQDPAAVLDAAREEVCGVVHG